MQLRQLVVCRLACASRGGAGSLGGVPGGHGRNGVIVLSVTHEGGLAQQVYVLSICAVLKADGVWEQTLVQQLGHGAHQQ